MLLPRCSWAHHPMLRYAHKKSPYAGIENSRLRVPKISTFHPERLIYSDFLVLSGRVAAKFHTELSLHSPGKVRDPFRWLYFYYQTYRQGGAEQDVELKSGDAALGDAISRGPTAKHVRVPFPEDAQGFLYLHQPPPESGLPLSESSIRFRCVPWLVDDSSSYLASIKPLKKWAPRPRPPVFLPSFVSKSDIRNAFSAGYDLISNGLPWSVSIVFVAGYPRLEFVGLQLLEDGLLSESELQEYKLIYETANHKAQPK